MLMNVKFPDYCDQNGPPSASNARYFGGRGVSPLQPQCPQHYFYWSTILVLWVTISCCLFAMSLASTGRYYHEATDEVAAEAVDEMEKQQRSPSSSPRHAAPASPSSPSRRTSERNADADALRLITAMQEALEAMKMQVAATDATAAALL